MNMKTKLTKARIKLIMRDPFYGSLAMKLKLVEDYSAPTLWTNGEQIGYNPDFIDSLTTDQTKFVIAHEVLHLVFGHQGRRKNRDRKVWNMAGDFVINGLLKKSGFKIKKNICLNKRFNDQVTEKVYATLIKDMKEDNLDGYNSKEQQVLSKLSGEMSSQNVDTSVVNDSNDTDIKSDPFECGEVRDAPKEDSTKKWEIAAIQAAQLAKSQGSNLTAGIKRIIEEASRNKITWAEELKNFFEELTKNDYTWTRPNPRYSCHGFYLPALQYKELDEIVVAVDTSGSINEKDLANFAKEISSILETFPTIKIKIIYCSNRIREDVTELTKDDLPFKFEAYWGGGTSFKPVFELVKTFDEKPKCLLYFTDLWCNSYPDIEPDYPVLWIDSDRARKKRNHYHIPPFGNIIKMDFHHEN